MQKRSPATVNFTGVPGAKSHCSPTRCHAELLIGEVAGRQRLSSITERMESIITHGGDSLATPNSSILLACQGIQT